MDPLDLLLHPVRVRIVNALSGGVTRTTAELCERLPDVSKATVYRHVGLLVDGGILDVADERRVHGAVERHYRLRRDRARIDGEAAASMSLDDHRHGFAAALAALGAEFTAYLDRPGADPAADSVGYRQGVLWLDPDELADLIGTLSAAVTEVAGNAATPARRPYLLSPIFFPAADPDR